MLKCIFCNGNIPINRRKRNGITKYCSNKCNYNSYYARKHPESSFFYRNDKKFWNTDTGRGLKWEKFAHKLLGGNHLLFNIRGNGIDIDWNGKSVDVKCANLNIRKNKRGKPVMGKQMGYWCFHRGKEKPMDYFFCIELINNKLHKCLLIPNDVFPKVGLTLGWNSKYDKYTYET